jgi:hypothetical protein
MLGHPISRPSAALRTLRLDHLIGWQSEAISGIPSQSIAITLRLDHLGNQMQSEAIRGN